MNPERAVFVLTPSLGRPSWDYLNSLYLTAYLCWKLNILLVPLQITRQSLLQDMRTSLLFAAYREGADDLFFVDDDGGWEPEGFVRLVKNPKEFVAGVWPKKIDEGEDYPVGIPTGIDGRPIFDSKDGTIKADYIGTAFMRLRRSVVERMIDGYHHLRYVDRDGQELYNLFEREWNDDSGAPAEPWGEDLSFCRKWRRIGGEIWLDPNINFTHEGKRTWAGNYYEFLRRQPGGDKHLVGLRKRLRFQETIDWLKMGENKCGK